jgi:hypothetical protein
MIFPHFRFFILITALFLGAQAGICESANSISQDGGQVSNKSASLVEAEASFDNDNLNITVKAEDLPDPSQIRVYLDTDADGSTGFSRPWRKYGATGADFLVEDNELSAWDGDDSQSDWHWTVVAGPIQTSPQGDNQLSYSIPLAPLKIKIGSQIRIFIESIAANGSTLDFIPRNSPWQVPVPQDALDKTIN